MNHLTLIKKLFITSCALTRTTNIATRYLGTQFFLPQLFVRRYANMGGLDVKTLTQQLSECRSFDDTVWCAYWEACAKQHLSTATDIFQRIIHVNQNFPDLDAANTLFKEVLLSAMSPNNTFDHYTFDNNSSLASLIHLFSSAAPAFFDHKLKTSDNEVKNLPHHNSNGNSYELEILLSMVLDQTIKAITYYQISAFPGHSHSRLVSYKRSRFLFDFIIKICSPNLHVDIKKVEITTREDSVHGYFIHRNTEEKRPTILITTGLEGTMEELIIPLIKFRNSDMNILFMEMPGSYIYKKNMNLKSENLYHDVITYLVNHPKVDANNIAMVGVSFGGYWATRMAATNTHLRCAVACGAPTQHSFSVKSSLGIPEIITNTLLAVTGTKNLLQLLLTLRNFSLKKLYHRITIPMLVINGTHDTLVSTEDSVEIKKHTSNTTLKLYPNDDHCAMSNYDEWLTLSQDWLHTHLTSTH